nr:Uncharacterised protein [Klebsiella pneumoniae]
MLTPLQLAVAAAEPQRDTIAFGVLLQNAQIELHYVPADQHVGVVFGKPGVKLFQQQGTAGDEDQLEVDIWRRFRFGAQHVDHPLAAAFQTDAVQLAVAAGFDIQRHPFQRRTIVRVRLHARVDQLRAARFAFHPHRGGDKALHQIALRRADIAFVNGDAAVAEHLLQTHQLAMGAAVEANNWLTVEIFQGQRGEAEPFLPLQQPFSLRPLRFGNKGDGLLRREGYLQRTVVGGQPEGELGALRSVPPVTGE